jgi:hypothetical protein
VCDIACADFEVPEERECLGSCGGEWSLLIYYKVEARSDMIVECLGALVEGKRA